MADTFHAVDHQDVIVRLRIELSNPAEGLWRARLVDDPTLNIDGTSREEAVLKAKALALLRLADETDREQGQMGSLHHLSREPYEPTDRSF